MKVFMTGYRRADTDLERGLLKIAGIDFDAALCAEATEIATAATDCIAVIVPSTPITDAVLDALPALKMISALGEELHHIDTTAAEKRGVWVSNVPLEVASTEFDRRRNAVLNVLSWLTRGVPANMVVMGR